MAKTTEEVLTGLLSTSYKLDGKALAPYKESDGSWKDEVLDHLLAKDAERVTALRGDLDKQLTERGARAKRETMEELEKHLRDEFGISDSNAKGVDLVKHIVAAKSAAAEKVPEERIKTHPLYVQLESELGKRAADFEAKLKSREEELKAEFKTSTLQRQAVQKGRAIFKGMNPVLPKNDAVADAQLVLLDNFIGGHKLKFVENDKGELVDIIPLNAEGSEALKDSHGHPITYDDLVKMGARKYFEFAEGEPKGGAPDPTKVGGGTGGSGGGSYDPKTEEEYMAMGERIIAEEKDLAERRKKLDALKAAAVKNGVIKG